MNKFSFLLLILIVFIYQLVLAEKVLEQPDALMLRFPDASEDQIVFVYANDLWTVSIEGGIARKLSSPAGPELFPKFSPDGKWIAFSGNYDGNIDVYVMPATGGIPKRLTHHPEDDLVVEWYPDSQHILYRSRMYSPSRRFNRLFKQSIDGGMPEVLPLPYGELASFSPDGNQLVFQIISREFRTWKRYRGGMASDLWLYDFQKNYSEKITEFAGTDALPMWHQNTIYFLSDRDENQKLNIWAYNVNTRKFHQVTRFTEYDVKWPSIGPTAIVFENGGKLYILDLATEKYSPISVKVPADLPRVRPQLKNVEKYIRNFSLSPTGKRALFEARGEIFTVPEKHGTVRNLTHTSGVAERYPAWSPDGKYIAFFSDKTGEYELYLRNADGKGGDRRMTQNGSVFRYQPVWSPDSKKIAFSDKTGSLYVLDLSTGKIEFVDKDDFTEIHDYSWSPDSRWLTYSKHMENANGVIMIYDTRTKETHQVTSDFYSDSHPVFDPEGKYLYFYSNRTLSPVYSDFDETWVYPNATNIYAVTLRKDVLSPLAPRNDEEEVTEEKNEEEKENKKKSNKNSKKLEEESKKEENPVNIDFEGFEKRAVKLPVEVKNTGPLKAVKGKVVFLRFPARGADKPGQPSGTLVYYDLDKREEKTVISGIDNFDISADGKKVIYKSKNTYGIIDLAEGKNVGDGKIATNKLQAWIDPKEEWQQMFIEAWRIERDYFYDPNMHGLDWEAIKKRYQALLPYINSRRDLNYVIGEMISELNSSHAYVSGGDLEQGKKISVGLLGCDFELDKKNNAYRIKKIYEGAEWDVDVRSPLREPGVQVNEGDYLLAVNGVPVDVRKDPWAAFQGLAGEVVTITVNSQPNMDGARDVLVKTLSSEFRLRYLAWVESNRKKVEEATGGRVGYVYVPNTGIDGQNELVRQFVAQYHKEGLIIDERFNSGGQIPDRFVELLNRPIYNYWARRDFRDWQTPFIAHTGPKVMLINQGW